MSRVFFDTNIFIYGIDSEQPRKRAIALALLEHSGHEQSGCISTQVLQEFFSAATRKLHMEPLQVKALLQLYTNWHITTIGPEDIEKAIDGNILWQISFWDALIIVAAAKLNCDRVYTEDLNHGQIINGVRIVNPFLEEKL